MPKESAYTSVNQVPALVKSLISQEILRDDFLTLDWGGGKYETTSEFLAEHGIRNIVYDPFNRTRQHNQLAMAEAHQIGADAIIVANVLNVITDPHERETLLFSIATLVGHIKKEHKIPVVVAFSIYEGNRSGVKGEKTSQNNLKTDAYIPEINEAFRFHKVRQTKKGNEIICFFD